MIIFLRMKQFTNNNRLIRVTQLKRGFNKTDLTVAIIGFYSFVEVNPNITLAFFRARAKVYLCVAIRMVELRAFHVVDIDRDGDAGPCAVAGIVDLARLSILKQFVCKQGLLSCSQPVWRC